MKNQSNTKAVFPGSFDPITKGHVDIVRRGLSVFDEIIVAVGQNTSKKNLFKPEQRLKMAERTFAEEPRIVCKPLTGLTVDFCKANGAGSILRGLRNGLDFEYEESIATMNRKLQPEVETFILFSSPEEAFISSTIVREIIINGGDVSGFVPKEIIQLVKNAIR